jgi:hypothetical protein
VGIQGSRAGTALRATFLRLSAPTGAAKKAIESLGVEVADMDGNLRSVPDLLKDISLATQDLGSVQRTSLIKTIFGEEAASGVSELLNQAGLSELDVAIANATSGGQGGAALQATFAQLEAPLRAASQQMASLGIQVTGVNGELRPVPDLLKALSIATAGLGDSQRENVLGKLFDENELETVTDLLDRAQTNVLDAAVNNTRGSDGTVNQISKQMSDTTFGALQRLGSALESVAISVGSLLLPSIATMAEGFATVASGVAGVADQFPLLTTVVVGTTVGLIGLRIATIAGAFAWTFMQGAWSTAATTLGLLSKALVLARGGLIRLNALGALTAVRMGIVTAAQWAWNVALTANPIGLIVVGIGALIGAGVLLVKHWDKVKTFFSGLWEGIKTLTGTAVDWLLEKIGLVFAPFKLFLQAGKVVGGAIGRFFTGDTEEDEQPSSDNPRPQNNTQARIGEVVNQSTATPNQLSTLSGAEAATVQRTTNHSVAIDAPITINAAPGMDEVAVAQQVRRELDQRQDQASADRRSQLFDGL